MLPFSYHKHVVTFTYFLRRESDSLVWGNRRRGGRSGDPAPRVLEKSPSNTGYISTIWSTETNFSCLCPPSQCLCRLSSRKDNIKRIEWGQGSGSHLLNSEMYKRITFLVSISTLLITSIRYPSLGD